MKKIVILSNHHAYTYNFRKEIIQKLLDENYKIYLVLPYGEKVELLTKMGCEFIHMPLDRRGMNPLTDLKLLFNYYKILKVIKPTAVLSYTVKPNIYGGIVCRILNIPFFPNITGLGSAFEKQGLLQKTLIQLSKIAYERASCIFFQNKENHSFFKKNNIKVNNYQIIPGSGVNIGHFTLLPYPSEEKIEFLFISRIMKEKGIEQYLDVAKYIKQKYQHTRFHILGFCEEDYEEKLKKLHKDGIIFYHGMQNDVREFHKRAHCIIHPTYYPEGMSNVLLEGAASGRPIITTNRSGCREIVDNEVNGYIVEQQNSRDLIEKVERFLLLNNKQKRAMGLAGRKKIENEFDRKIVVECYFNEIKKLV